MNQYVARNSIRVLVLITSLFSVFGSAASRGRSQTAKQELAYADTMNVFNLVEK